MPYSCTGVHAAFRLDPSARPKKRFYSFDRIYNIALILMTVLSILSLMWIASCQSMDNYYTDPCGTAAGQYIAVPTSASNAGAKANPHD